jgi:hypothetical protein
VHRAVTCSLLTRINLGEMIGGLTFIRGSLKNVLRSRVEVDTVVTNWIVDGGWVSTGARVEAAGGRGGGGLNPCKVLSEASYINTHSTV